jgi:hypothetical protein
MFVSSVLLLALSGPLAQSPAAPANVRAYRSESPIPVRFSVQTSVGLVQGTALADVEGRALDGWGRFELKVALDPTSVRTGEGLRDRIIARHVLGSSRGPLLLGSVTWLKPGSGGERADAPSLPGAGTWVDGPIARRYLELRYTWEQDKEVGTLRIEHEASLVELGLASPPHPFIEVRGPVSLSMQARLVRER